MESETSFSKSKCKSDYVRTLKNIISFTPILVLSFFLHDIREFRIEPCQERKIAELDNNTPHFLVR